MCAFVMKAELLCLDVVRLEALAHTSMNSDHQHRLWLLIFSGQVIRHYVLVG